jgi:predicted O-linked N-acetylglucosamine transferase (SPINDLY family)
VAALFSAAGLAPERLLLLPWVEGWHNHMACYREVDVALDPLPYGGATTSCEALAMGVPLVSLAGPGMVGCLSTSVLVHGAGGEGLAESEQAYIAQAKGLAQPQPRTLEQRLAVRRRLLASPLADGPRLSRELERLYRELACLAQRR